MVPKFTSMTDMIGFLRALPKNANYVKMLKDDFGYDAPADAEKWQPEYFWKYLVQGQYKGLTGKDLEKYAVDGALKIKDTYHVDLKDEKPQVIKPVKVVATTGKPGRHKIEKQPDGAVTFAEHRNKWFGWMGGKVVVTVTTEEACRAKMAARIGAKS